MRTVGFVISHKENEKRRAMLPEDVVLVQNRDAIYFEKGYWNVFGIEDAELSHLGIQFASRDDVLGKDIICDPKIGDAEYLERLHDQSIFGWIHAVQNRDITDRIIAGRLTAYAWEDMFDSGRHLFWRNNEIAGEAAIMHAFQCYGDMPYNAKVALIGMGNVARGALKILTLLGADVTVYTRKTENLLKMELEQYDVVVNALLWDVTRKDHIIYRKDLKRLKPHALIIDISCDRSGAIETSIPTAMDNPVYTVDGVMHYVVDHTPSLFYRMVSAELSKVVSGFLDPLIAEETNAVLLNAKIIDHGRIIDNRITQFQGRSCFS